MSSGLFKAAALAVAGAAVGWTVARSQPNPGTAKQPPPVVENAKAGKPLETLDWMVGDWVAEGEGRSAEFSCHFTKNGSFLVRSYRILAMKDVTVSGMQVIGWDAAKETIRSWTFDSHGGFGEDVWSQSGNRYTIRAKYTLPDGGTGSALNVMTYIDDDKCAWKSVNREIDGELQPDIAEIVLVRRHVEAEPKGGK